MTAAVVRIADEGSFTFGVQFAFAEGWVGCQEGGEGVQVASNSRLASRTEIRDR